MKKKPVAIVEAGGIRITKEKMRSRGEEYQYYRLTYHRGNTRYRERAKTFKAAEKRAKELAEKLGDGTLQFDLKLTAKDNLVIHEALTLLRNSGGKKLLDAVRQFTEADVLLAGEYSVIEAVRKFKKELDRGKPMEIGFPELVEKFLAEIKTKNRSRRYRLDMQARLHKAARTFKGQVADIRAVNIDAWLEGMDKTTGRTKNNYRKAIITVLRYAKAKNYLPREDTTEGEFSTIYTVLPGEIGIYTPEQLKLLLTRISPRMLPAVALGAFAGLRSAEISRLEWEHIQFDDKVIAVPPSVAKKRIRRLAPILPVLAAWLRPYRKTNGKVLVRIGDEFALTTVFKAAVDAITGADGKPLISIIHNGLRHSFVSYRVAQLKNINAVAVESGNSPNIIETNYWKKVKVKPESWFNQFPTKKRLLEIRKAISTGL
ncbi:MAG: site-specific integrase [Deltaproteobacteria bacterium]